MAKKKEKLSFEDAMEELEEVIFKLEEGELTLDKSLDEFQKGIELYKHCNGILNDVDGKIKLMLEKEEGTIEEVDFKEKL